MMMQSKNNVLRLAVLAALTAGSMGANAALIAQDAAAFTAVKFASESPTTGTTLTATTQFTVGSTTTSFAPTAGQSLQVTVDLTGGAKFVAAPTMTCRDGTAGNNSAAGTLNLGGAGSNQAVFTLASAAWGTAAQISQCVVTATTVSVTGAHADVNMGLSYLYGNLASSQASGALITFVTGLSAGKAVGADVVALVTGGFLAVSGGSASTVINVGDAFWNGNGTANSATLGSTVELGTILGATSGTITVAGNALQAAKATAGVFLVTAAANCTDGTAGGAQAVATAAGGASPITFTGLTPSDISAGLSVCVQFNGSTAIPEGSITATVGGTALTGYSLPAATTQTLMTVSRNGSSASVMNMPRSTDTDAGFLRVYNTSSLAGAVTATVYDQAGTALATNCSLSSSLASQAALVMSAAQIETACGFTVPTTGRYRLELAGAFPSMQAQMFARSAGVLTNITSFTSN